MEVIGAASTFPGSSLARHWRSSSTKEATPLLSEINIAPIRPRECAPRAKAVITSLVLDRYHYLRNPDGGEELYDYVSDPLERNDIADSDNRRDVMVVFRSFLRYQTEQRNTVNAD
jgi:hypothetical protein